MRSWIVVGISSLALAGCGGTGQDQKRQDAATLPSPRPGLWREIVSRDGHGLGLIGNVQACLDADARSRLSAVGGHAEKSMCQDQTVSHDPDGGYRFGSTCNLGPGGRTVTRGLLIGDLANRYRVHSETDTTGASVGGLNGHHIMDLEADYLGPCPADMTAGDVIIANGMKVNMNRLRSVADSLVGGG